MAICSLEHFFFEVRPVQEYTVFGEVNLAKIIAKNLVKIEKPPFWEPQNMKISPAKNLSPGTVYNVSKLIIKKTLLVKLNLNKNF